MKNENRYVSIKFSSFSMIKEEEPTIDWNQGTWREISQKHQDVNGAVK